MGNQLPYYIKKQDKQYNNYNYFKNTNNNHNNSYLTNNNKNNDSLFKFSIIQSITNSISLPLSLSLSRQNSSQSSSTQNKQKNKQFINALTTYVKTYNTHILYHQNKINHNKKYYILKTHLIPNKKQYLKIISNNYYQNNQNFQTKIKTFKNIQNIVHINQQQYSNNPLSFCLQSNLIKIYFQYYDVNLLQQINHQKYTLTQILSFFKFFIQLFKELSQQKINYPIVGLQNIYINASQYQSSYKLQNPIYYLFDQPYVQKLFYPPQKFLINSTLYKNDYIHNQSQIVFSLGMVLLSLTLSENCYDCYDYKNYTFCWSVLQSKLMKLQSSQLQRQIQSSYQYDQTININSTLNHRNGNISLTKLQSNIGVRTSSQIIDAIYMMLQKDPEKRPSISQIFQIYKNIMKSFRQIKKQFHIHHSLDDIQKNSNNNNILKQIFNSENSHQKQIYMKSSSKQSHFIYKTSRKRQPKLKQFYNFKENRQNIPPIKNSNYIVNQQKKKHF